MLHAFSALYYREFNQEGRKAGRRLAVARISTTHEDFSHGLTRIFTIGFHHEEHEGHEEVSPRIARNGKPKRIQKTATDVSSAHRPDPARASQKPFLNVFTA
jgi:hypothetical protein